LKTANIRAAMEKAGYAGEVPAESASMVLGIQGMPKTGKTSLALSAPGPIAYHALDTGDDGVIQKAKESGKVVFPMNHSYYLPRELRVEPEFPPRVKDSQGEWRPAEEEINWFQNRAKWVHEHCWQPFEDANDAAIAAGVRTIVWDTDTEVWEMKRLAHLRRIKDSGVNLILVRQLKEDFVTKKMVAQGMSKIGYLVDAQVETYHRPSYVRGKDTVPMEFGVQILMARQKMELVGTKVVLGSPDFMSLAAMLKPAVDPDLWQDSE
jgi:hypothetical protein